MFYLNLVLVLHFKTARCSYSEFVFYCSFFEYFEENTCIKRYKVKLCEKYSHWKLRILEIILLNWKICVMYKVSQLANSLL